MGLYASGEEFEGLKGGVDKGEARI